MVALSTGRFSYKKDYSNTQSTVTLSGPGVSRAVSCQYPYKVHFQAFEPSGTYNWSVTVDNVSGGNWSFKVSDKIYPLNDRSINLTDKKSLIPYQIKNLKVSNNIVWIMRTHLRLICKQNYFALVNSATAKDCV